MDINGVPPTRTVDDRRLPRSRLKGDRGGRGAAGGNIQRISVKGRSISTIHDLDSVAGFHDVRGRLEASQGSVLRCSRVVIAADLRTNVVRSHSLFSQLNRYTTERHALSQSPALTPKISEL